MNKTVYQYTDDSWVDGDPDCPCCSGLTFEAYNSVGWEQNGSATSLWNLYVDALVYHMSEELDESIYNIGEFAYDFYEMFTLEEIIDLCDRRGIILEKVEL